MRKWVGFTLALTVLFFLPTDAFAQFNGLPNHTLTPGAFNPAVTQSTIKKTICISGWTATIRPKPSYTTALKIQQLNSGYSVNGDTKPSDYEEDHLVPLEIGGSPTSPLNLWPELWNDPLGAHLKDKLENKIHSLICKGQMSLATGRSVFTGDWTSYYKIYYGALPVSSETPTASETPAPTPTVVATPTPSASQPSPIEASASPTPTPVASQTPSSNSTLPLITAGAFCSTTNAMGKSAKGVTYTCKASATDTRLRWRQ